MKKKTQKTMLLVGAIAVGGFIAWKYLLPIIGIAASPLSIERERLTAAQTPSAKIVVTPQVVTQA